MKDRQPARRTTSETMSTEDFLRELFREEERKQLRSHVARTVQADGSMRTEDFLREVVFGIPVDELPPPSARQKGQNDGSGGNLGSSGQRSSSGNILPGGNRVSGGRHSSAGDGGNVASRPVAHLAPGSSPQTAAPLAGQAGQQPLPFSAGVAECGGLNLHCFVSPEGKLLRKEERTPQGTLTWDYAFDGKGHLTTATCNGQVAERYGYNEKGQRRADYRAWNNEAREFQYDRRGRLVRAGQTTLTWAENGSLESKTRNGQTIRLDYGTDSRLKSATLPTGQTVTYSYGNSLLPERITLDGAPVLEYVWQDHLRLIRCRDLRTNTQYDFHYAQNQRAPVRVTLRGPLAQGMIQGMEQRLENGPAQNQTPGRALNMTQDRPLSLAPEMTQDMARGGPHSPALPPAYTLPPDMARGVPSTPLPGAAHPSGLGMRSRDSIDLAMYADQVDSMQRLATEGGHTISSIAYDSFGNVTTGTLPQLYLPLGFACGLNDPFTGLVRFGFRDYDPEVGRFTAKDPLGDTGGDHDVWDYCVDDPVSMNDPSGLFAPALAALGLFLGGMGASLGVGLGGAYGAASATDALSDGESTAARDAIKAVAPMVAGTVAAGALPGAAVLAPPAAADITAKAGAAIQVHNLAKAAGMAATAAEFAEGALVPVSPAAASFSGSIGGAAKLLYDQYQHEQNMKALRK